MMSTGERGYVGLIILLISAAIIGLIFMFTVMKPEKDPDDPYSIGRTDFDKAQQTIEYGEETKEFIDSQNQKMIEEINSM